MVSFEKVTIDLLIGFLENCELFGMTLLLSLPLGLIITFGSMSKFKPLAWLTKTIVWIIRGTPLMLQIFVVFYVPGLVFDMPMRNRMLAALIAFVINYSCYFSEIYRGGIQSISKGQYEAGQVLGMTKTQAITLVKDTSLARVIAVSEILMCAERFTGKGLIWPLFYTGVFFLAFNGVLTLLFGYAEKKLDYFRS